MAKDKIAYVCSNCGQDSPKWIGKCPNCGQWNTFKEIRIAADTGQQAAKMAAQTVASTVHGKSRPVHSSVRAEHSASEKRNDSCKQSCISVIKHTGAGIRIIYRYSLPGEDPANG